MGQFWGFQLAPQALNDFLREAKAADDDTVSCLEIFTDGSSLIPRAWPRMAASGRWGAHVTAFCDNHRSAVIGMFFGEVTVDIGHQFFCGADSVHIGACEIQTVFAAFVVVPRCQFGGLTCQNQTRQQICHWRSGQGSSLHFTRDWCVPRDNAWRGQDAGGQWQNECADSLARMGSYSFPTVTPAIADMSEGFPHRAAPPQRWTKCRLSRCIFSFFSFFHFSIFPFFHV